VIILAASLERELFVLLAILTAEDAEDAEAPHREALVPTGSYQYYRLVLNLRGK
jgi:hypothetical protein